MTNELLNKYILGETDEKETESVVNWIKQSPENLNCYNRERKLNNLLLCNCVQNKTKVIKKDQRHLVYNILKIAAVLLLLISLSFNISNFVPKKENISYQSIQVPAGQRVNIKLSDGTNVWLNSRTTLKLSSDFNKKERIVCLNGEGYFKVSKNKNKPFIIKTNKYNVKVLGTEFNICAYKNENIWETSLIRGSVEILEKKDEKSIMRLKPGFMVRTNKSKLDLSKIKYYDNFQWREGLLCFKEIKLKDIFHKLELYYGVKIILKSKIPSEGSYTGKFRIDDGIEHALKTLQLKNNFIYKRDEMTNNLEIKMQ